MIGSMELAAALLLVAAGAGKVWAPDAAAVMLRRAWWRAPRGPAARGTVRAAGIVEIAVGAAVIGFGDRVSAALLAGCYLSFLGVAARLQLSGRRESCGCFGSTESPVGVAHLVVNIAAVVGAVSALLGPPGSLGGAIDTGGLAGVVEVGQATVLAYLAYLSMTALPALTAARRRLLETA